MTTSVRAERRGCPPWCTAEHGVLLGEEDHLHIGADVPLTDSMTARLCATIDPESGETDGPYVIVDSLELSLDCTRSIGNTLLALADTALEVGATNMRGRAD
ncbi:hypothetical protein ACVBEQ_05120 [Nakamurella sp. GG22]